MTLVNITQAAKKIGVCTETIRTVIRSMGISRSKTYNLEALVAGYATYRARDKRRALAADEERGWLECTRCGRIDTDNDVRGGLCLDCWCRDYNRDHPIRKEAIAGICESEMANARDVASQNSAKSKKTGNDKGKGETREERAENDVNERAAQ